MSRPSREIALSIFQHIRKVLAPFIRIRRIEFSDLPKTISGKIRRIELRYREVENVRRSARPEFEFREEDFRLHGGTKSKSIYERPFLYANAVLPGMRARHQGRIINLARHFSELKTDIEDDEGIRAAVVCLLTAALAI